MKTTGWGLGGIDTDTLKAAQVGWRIKLKEMQGSLLEIEVELRQRGKELMPNARDLRRSPTTTPIKHKHKISKAGRERIAAAQKKRWAKVAREKKAAVRKVSAKGKEE